MAVTLCSVLVVSLLCITYAHADDVNDIVTGEAPGNNTETDRSSFYLSPGSGNFSPTREKKYILRNINVNWYRALHMCFAEGKRLAIIRTVEDNNNLKKYIREMGGPIPANMWIGAADLGEEGRFIWMPTGEPVSYTNWYLGEPGGWGPQPDNNAGKEHCVHTWYLNPTHLDKLQWNDEDCSVNYPFICEYTEEMPKSCLQYKSF